MAGFVADAQRAVQQKVNLPASYSLEWGGQFEQLQSASKRWAIAVPAALLLIYSLLYLNFHSFRTAALILLNVPLAATGGVAALLIRGMPFSVSAGVGFIALFGIAVLNGVVLVSYILELRQKTRDVKRCLGSLRRSFSALSCSWPQKSQGRVDNQSGRNGFRWPQTIHLQPSL